MMNGSCRVMRRSCANKESSLEKRAAEKQAARDADAQALASAQLQEENSFLPLHAIGKIDFSKIPIAR